MLLDQSQAANNLMSYIRLGVTVFLVLGVFVVSLNVVLRRERGWTNKEQGLQFQRQHLLHRMIKRSPRSSV